MRSTKSKSRCNKALKKAEGRKVLIGHSHYVHPIPRFTRLAGVHVTTCSHCTLHSRFLIWTDSHHYYCGNRQKPATCSKKFKLKDQERSKDGTRTFYCLVLHISCCHSRCTIRNVASAFQMDDIVKYLESNISQSAGVGVSRRVLAHASWSNQLCCSLPAPCISRRSPIPPGRSNSAFQSQAAPLHFWTASVCLC